MDIVKILGFGLSGLTFLLFVLSFRLISQEQKQTQPRGAILKMIIFFMLLTLISTVTVGWFGIVQNKNQELVNKNDSLLISQSKIISDYINFINTQNEKKVENIKTGSKNEIIEQVSSLRNNTDTLVKNLIKINPQKAEEISKQTDWIQNLLTEIKQTPQSDTEKIKMLSNKVILTNSRIRQISTKALRMNTNKANLDSSKF